MNNFIGKSQEIGDKFSENNQYPAIAQDANGNNIVVWEKADKNGEKIILKVFEKNGTVSELLQVSGTGLGLKPAAKTVGDTTWIAWSEYNGSEWAIYVRAFKNGLLDAPIMIEKGIALFYVSLASIGGNIAVLYNRQGAKKSETVLARMGNDGSFVTETVSISKKTYRPTAAENGNGDVMVVYDSFDGKTYNILSRVLSNGKWTEEVRLDSTENRCAQPVVVPVESNKFTICWYENGIFSFYSYNAIDASYKDGKIEIINYNVLVQNRNWYNNIDATSNKDGYVVFCYTIGKYNVLSNIRQPDGTWSKPILLSYNDGKCGMRPKAVLDDDGKLSYVWQWAEKNGHMDRHAVIVYNTTSLEEIGNADDSEIVTRIDPFVQPIDVVKSLDSVPEKKKNAWLKKNRIKDYIFFGDIHGQSNMSDGMGELDHYYHFAKNDAAMDFCALTDHDCYPDEATQSEWEWNRTTRNIFNEEDDFSVLLAFEWTSNEYNHDFGHKNVYYPSSEGGLYTSLSEEGLNPDRLFKSIKKDRGLCIPHHPAADWGSVSAATDWDYHDPEVQRAVEIFSRHANYEKTEDSSRYTKNIGKFPHKCIKDALARGYKLGFTAGSDSHQMEHGKEGGILGAFMSENTSEELWKAIWNRKTYGTTGARILLSFKMGNAFMGDEVKCEGKREFICSVFAVNDVRSITIIKNGKIVFFLEPKGLEADFTFTDVASSTSDYYYLRVEQKDDHIAWSSPIFVN